MKNFILCLGLCILLCAPLYGQGYMAEYSEYVGKAEALYTKKEYLESARTYSQAFDKLGSKGLSKDRYNAAKSWSMAKIPDTAFFNLQRIAEKQYYDDIDKISKEEDFNSLHTDKRWQPLLALISKNNENKLPDSFFRAGAQPNSYFMGVDKGAGKDGNNVITIKSIDKSIQGFGTVMKNIHPEKYLGKRIKMTGYLKTKDVENWAGFWLRIDGEKESASLAFDNMKNGKTDRSVKGTTDWKQYKIVLDVSEEATNIAFGTLLAGTGQIWFDKIEFEIVDDNTDRTGPDKETTGLDK